QTAFDVRAAAGRQTAPSYQLLLRFATTPEAIVKQMERARSLVGGMGQTSIVTGDAESQLWNEVAQGPWSAPGAIVRLSWLASSLSAVLALMEDLGRSVEAALVGRVVVGAGFLRLQG